MEDWQDPPVFLWTVCFSAVHQFVNAPSWMELIARSGVGVSCAVRAWVVATVGLFVMSESAHNSRWFALEYKTSGPRFCHVLLSRPGLTS